jgi:hypothetical protein
MADQCAASLTHRVRLNFRSIAGTYVPFETILSSSQSVYANYGIKIEMASGDVPLDVEIRIAATRSF